MGEGHIADTMLQPTKTALAYGIGTIATYWFIERMIT